MGNERRNKLDLPAWSKSILLILLTVVIWWFITTVVLDKPRIYPTPQLVIQEMWSIIKGEGPMGSSYRHATATLYRLLIAFAGAFVIGTGLGILAGRIRPLFHFLNIFSWIGLAVPSVVWVFVFLVVFGINNVVPVVALMVMLTTPTFIGSAEGARALDPELITMAKSYRAGWWSRLVDIYIPGIVPFLMSNGRVAFALGVKVVIIAEVVGLPDGVGLLVKYWKDQLFLAPVIAWGLLLAALGFIADRWLFGYFERKAERRIAGARKQFAEENVELEYA